MPNIQDIFNFIDAAENSRKYPHETAKALKVSLKKFEETMSDEEKASVDIFEDRFDSIFNAVYGKNIQTMTAGSLDTYRKRAKKALGDYKKYGTNSSAMTSWKPTVRIVVKKQKNDDVRPKTDERSVPNNTEEELTVQNLSTNQNLTENHDVIFKSGEKARIIVPASMTSDDIKSIEALIGYFKSRVENNANMEESPRG